MGRKDEVQMLAKRFGGCGCKDRCQMEQFGEEGRDQKPNGRFSACETEAADLGVAIPPNKKR